MSRQKNVRSKVTFLSRVWKSPHPGSQEAEAERNIIMHVYGAKHSTKPAKYFFFQALRATHFWYQNNREKFIIRILVGEWMTKAKKLEGFLGSFHSFNQHSFISSRKHETVLVIGGDTQDVEMFPSICTAFF